MSQTQGRPKPSTFPPKPSILPEQKNCTAPHPRKILPANLAMSGISNLLTHHQHHNTRVNWVARQAARLDKRILILNTLLDVFSPNTDPPLKPSLTQLRTRLRRHLQDNRHQRNSYMDLLHHCWLSPSQETDYNESFQQWIRRIPTQTLAEPGSRTAGSSNHYENFTDGRVGLTHIQFSPLQISPQFYPLLVEISPPLLNLCLRIHRTPRRLLGEAELLDLTPLIWDEATPLHQDTMSIRTGEMARSYYPYSPKMNILIWNCRGAANPMFIRHFRELYNQHKPALAIITETRIAGDTATTIANSLPLKLAYCTDSIGFRGGIWIMWNPSLVAMELLSTTEQEIHTEVRLLSSTSTWLLSAIYASPRKVEREIVWNNCRTIADAISHPWLMAGDFNSILHPTEKIGGNRVTLSQTKSFADCLDYCSLIDLGYSGPKTTWSNLRNSGRISERLDRAVANLEWLNLFPDANVQHLPRMHSDHRPLLLSLQQPQTYRLPRPYRFQTAWLSHEDLPHIIEETWIESKQHYITAAKLLRERTTRWNREVFGNIIHKKKRIQAKLQGIHIALEKKHSSFLIELERELTKDYNTILSQEEQLWKMKARASWIIEGERNTRFFHASTMARRRANRLSKLKIDDTWIEDQQSLAEAIRASFEIRYTSTTETNVPLPKLDPLNTPKLNQTQAGTLKGFCSMEEVKTALFSMHPNKAPEPDGIHPILLQKYWNITKESILRAAQEAFQTKRISEGLGDSLITLIPKTQNPETIDQLRPTSLCNTIYKVVTKIIVNRMRPTINKLVAPYQCSFLPGRRTTDNYIIAQEILHTYSAKQDRKGYIAIKVDLNKAFDQLEWSFIDKMLILWNFPLETKELIMSCITCPKFSILFNGGELRTISPTRGLRQGDPLSPYIFIICLEFLGYLIERECANGKWNKVATSRGCPLFSHLFFADDLLLFAEADMRNAAAIKRALKIFSKLSGQEINTKKTRIFFSSNVSTTRSRRISKKLGYPRTTNLGTYLGFPLQTASHRYATFAPTIDKIMGWQSKLLSLPGRLILLKSVAEAIPAYQMSCLSMPRKAQEEIDRLNRNFLWKSTDNERKLHLANWNLVTKRREEGGLGLFKARERNIALLSGLNWRLHNESNSKWGQVIIHKYGLNLEKRKQGSSIFKGLKLGKPTFDKGAQMMVADGRRTRFWLDDWTRIGKLRNYLIGPLYKGEENKSVCQYRKEGEWTRLDAACFINDQIWHNITTTFSTLDEQGEDNILWKLISTGEFTTSSAYSQVNLNTRETNPVNLSWIWKLPILPKQKTFIWLAWWNKLPTRDLLIARGIISDNQCPICELDHESVQHTLRDCPIAQVTWGTLPVPPELESTYALQTPKWLEANLHSAASRKQKRGGIQWNIIFVSAIWNIWLRRNQQVFDHKRNLYNNNIILERAAELQALLVTSKKDSRLNTIDSHAHWKPSEEDCYTLNIDGATGTNSLYNGLGGVVRDNSGKWIGDFCKRVASTNCLMAEAMALYEGLLFALNLGLLDIAIQSDAELLVKYITGELSCSRLMFPIISNCRLLYSRFRRRSIKHTKREGNRVADKLAKMALNQEDIFTTFSYPPDQIINILHGDVPCSEDYVT